MNKEKAKLEVDSYDIQDVDNETIIISTVLINDKKFTVSEWLVDGCVSRADSLIRDRGIVKSNGNLAKVDKASRVRLWNLLDETLVWN